MAEEVTEICLWRTNMRINMMKNKHGGGSDRDLL